MKQKPLALAAALFVGLLGSVHFVSAAAPTPVAALMSSKAQQGLLLGMATAGQSTLAVGGNGVILRSTDGGGWTQVKSPVDSALTQIAFADRQQGWAVGHDHAILHSADGGQNWTLQNWQPEVAAPLFAVLPLDANRVIAAGAFSSLKLTTDGGRQWTDLDVPALSAEKYHFNALTRLRDGRLLVAGEHGLVGLSTDGSAWQRVATPYEGSFFGALPVGEHGALVFGMRGNVFYADDPQTGQWEKIETGTTASLFGGSVLGEDAILVGADGVIVRVNASQRKTSAILVKGLNRDQVFAAVQMTSQRMIVAGDKGVLKLTLPRQ